jgi:TolA-binding protein
MFPFLAVLLCTMGALVLMLILMVSQSQAVAREQKQQKNAEMAATIDGIVVRAELAESEFRDRNNQVEDARQRLTHLEDHIRRLMQELAELETSFDRLEERQKSESAEEAQLQVAKEAEIDALKSEIEIASELLSDKLAEQKENSKAFAIVPYTGANGTARRPIYLECRGDGVVLQPEGILLSFDDLKPPFTPGNPLDACLRAIRNRMLETQLTNSRYSNAYPLLLVRPDGIRSYTLARASMKNWDDQFGYELIGQDMPLVFPKSPPGLNELLKETVRSARERQNALMSSLPPSMRRSLEAVGSGDGGDFEPLQTRSARQRNGAPSVDDRIRDIGQNWADVDGVNSPSRLANQLDSSIEEEVVNNRLSQPVSGTNRSPGIRLQQPDEPWQFSAIEGLQGGSPSSGGRTQNESDPRDNPEGDFGDIPENSTDDAVVQGASRGRPADFGSADAREGSVGAAEPMTLDFGDSIDFDSGVNTSGGTQASGAAEGNSSDSSAGSPSNASTEPGASGQSSPMSQMDSNASSGNGGTGITAMVNGAENDPDEPQSRSFGYQNRSASQPSNQPANEATDQIGMDEKRWSEPDALRPVEVNAAQSWTSSRQGDKRTPVIRAIQMAVTKDRWFVVDAADNTRAERVIELSDGPSNARNELVEVLQKRMNGWGTAVAGGYWKPVLSVRLLDNDSLSFQRLDALLRGSGIELRIAR